MAFICILIFCISYLHSQQYGLGNYEHIPKKIIRKNLHEEISLNFTTTALFDCQYHDVLFDENTLSSNLVDADLIQGHGIKEGGEYAPSECKPKFSTAIIVPYRDRAEQLRGFLIYLHTFLRRQHIHYRIYVIEEVDTCQFNRAKLLNVGAKISMTEGFPCLILHDVDLLPLKPANLYACTKYPRHMSSSIDKFRFVLPYPSLCGGAMAITSKQYKTINGMSNEYYGWGGEDDDLYMRLQEHQLNLCRFEPRTSQYHMVMHQFRPKGSKTKNLLKFAKERMKNDGLNSLKYTLVATVLHPLFTHVMVDFKD